MAESADISQDFAKSSRNFARPVVARGIASKPMNRLLPALIEEAYEVAGSGAPEG